MMERDQLTVPPGFRFHPTEEELLYYYLRKKVSYEAIDLNVIREIDLNKLEPWDLKDKCRIGSGPQNEWYFFSHKDKKYPTGTRTNRATSAGFWKATGRDKAIHLTDTTRIGMRKTLVFYTGRAPHGQKTDWIMHEYRLDDELSEIQEEGWVVCRVFKKRVQNKGFALEETDNELMNPFQVQYHQNLTHYNHDNDKVDAAMHIPHFLSSEHAPKSYFSSLSNNLSNSHTGDDNCSHNFMMSLGSSSHPGVNDWSLLDRLISSSHDFTGQFQGKSHPFISALPGTNHVGASSQKFPFDVFAFSK